MKGSNLFSLGYYIDFDILNKNWFSQDSNISEDKKSIEITNSNFIESMKFSYLLYFSRYHHVAKYTNGGLDFLGFFNEKYEKIDKINIHNFDIVECIGTCNFDGLRKPTFNFNLIHEYGNKHSSLRGDILVPRTCQKALDSVWELEEFYISFYERIIESPPSASGYKWY